MDSGSIQSWLGTLFPYIAISIPAVLSLRNSRKLDRVQDIATRVEVNGNGHTTALIAMAAAVDPEIAALARAKIVDAAKVDAAAVLKTADETRGDFNAARKG